MKRKLQFAAFSVVAGLGSYMTVSALYGTSNTAGVPGIMPDFTGVKLTPVAKLPVYVVDNKNVQMADSETASFLMSYMGTTQLEMLSR